MVEPRFISRRFVLWGKSRNQTDKKLLRKQTDFALSMSGFLMPTEMATVIATLVTKKSTEKKFNVDTE